MPHYPSVSLTWQNSTQVKPNSFYPLLASRLWNSLPLVLWPQISRALSTPQKNKLFSFSSDLQHPFPSLLSIDDIFLLSLRKWRQLEHNQFAFMPSNLIACLHMDSHVMLPFLLLLFQVNLSICMQGSISSCFLRNFNVEIRISISHSKDILPLRISLCPVVDSPLYLNFSIPSCNISSQNCLFYTLLIP